MKSDKMREVKFKARRVDVPPGWVYGYFVVENGKYYIINDDGKFGVVAGTESQYTGLKDKYDKEVYDNDVIEFRLKNTNSKGVGVVNWSDDEFAWIINIVNGPSSAAKYFLLSAVDDVVVVDNAILSWYKY